MRALLLGLGLRTRVALTRVLTRLGFNEDSFLLPLALLIGIVTAIAAVAFHELIVVIRNSLYRGFSPAWGEFLYGPGLFLLVLIPAGGGLAVGLFSTYVMRAREGHGVVDVMESVTRSSGWIRPLSAVEKILTSAMTIGSGGSAGAEGPIVQIGAAISSAVGQVFQVARQHLPVLIGCGTAAGISAIFNSPIGGVLFTLEIILLDFSIRAFTPVVIASVIANVTTQAILHGAHGAGAHRAIFSLPGDVVRAPSALYWQGVPNFILLGLVCGAVGVVMTRAMYLAEERFARLRVPRALKPALGGAALGLLGVTYVVIFGRLLLGRHKPVHFSDYPMPAFFGDGYGFVQQLFQEGFYREFPVGELTLLLVVLCVAKVVGTCLTLASGGSGGIIAPSLFLGAAAGAALGLGLRQAGFAADVPVAFYALVGMGAVLGAVVHAPLAAILILFEVSGQRNVILPAMLATVVATGTARLIFRDSIYTLTLRRRGVRVGTGSDLTLLRRLTVEQVGLEPVSTLRLDTPFEQLLHISDETGATDFVVLDGHGGYAGMVVAEDIKTALLQREAIPLLLAGEVVRPELPCVRTTDDLASVLETFSRYDVNRLPVCVSGAAGRVVGLISRSALMRRYHEALS